MASLSSTASVNIPRLDGLGGNTVYGDFSATGDITGENIVANISLSSPYVSGTSVVSNAVTVSGDIAIDNTTGRLTRTLPIWTITQSSCAVAHNTWTGMKFGSTGATTLKNQGTHNMTLESTNYTTFTSTVAQVVTVNFYVGFPANIGGASACYIAHGSNQYAMSYMTSSTATGAQNGSFTFYMAANDTFYIACKQTSGVSQNLSGGISIVVV